MIELHGMDGKNGARIGSGWKLVDRFPSREALLIASCDEGHDGGFKWSCLDVETGKMLCLPELFGNEFRAGVDKPNFSPSTRELICECRGGIAAYDLALRKEELVVPLDPELQAVLKLWLSPKKDFHLVYLLRTQDVPSSRIFSAPAVPDGANRIKISYSYQVFSLAGRHSRPMLVCDLPSGPGSADVDWNGGIVFVSLDDHRILAINLDTGKIDHMGTRVNINLSTSPHGTLITWSSLPQQRLIPWGPGNPHIEETLPDGRTFPLTNWGWYPSFSPDGTKIAFTVWHNELWLMVGKAVPEKILSFKKGKQTHIGADTPTWCRCSQHFAVQLETPDARGFHHGPLAIVNVATHDVMLRYDPSRYQEGRVWVPAEVVMPLFRPEERA